MRGVRGLDTTCCTSLLFGQMSSRVREHFSFLIAPVRAFTARIPEGSDSHYVGAPRRLDSKSSPPFFCCAFVARRKVLVLVGPALTGCASEKKEDFSTGQSIGTKASSDELGHLRRPLSKAVAVHSSSGGRKPGRWLFSTLARHRITPFRPSRFNWACSAQRPPSALWVVSAQWVRDGSG